ncbi:MAG: 16S rRNA (guanine(966)-N(2))-methyltransferase RsmD [Candidatus Margulisiibacteriota bacterium]|jgi:16S rRNA (guanine(966)-N(2))-methyltransferase RsmD
MHIIGGIYKGRNLFFSKNDKLRPSQNKVREALFDILQERIVDTDFLDLCSGTGGIGLEAISRGANRTMFVDLDVSLIYKNRAILSEIDQQKCNVYKQDAINFLKKCKSKFDIIFFDPPWQSIELYKLALNSIIEFDILKPKGLLIIEHRKNVPIPIDSDQAQIKDYKYGDTILTFVSLKTI